jgi:hypothetical protein
VHELRTDRQQRSRRGDASSDGKPILEGGRNDTLMSLAGSMRRRGMGLEAIEAALLAENERRCQPPLDDTEVRSIAASAMRYPARGERGEEAAPDQADGDQEEPPSGHDIILAHFRKVYEPTFRHGDAISSSTRNRDVKRSEACHGAPIDLIEQLEAAIDAPRGEQMEPKRSAMPGFFKKWAPHAWATMIRDLPEEEEAEEISESARERFRAFVRNALSALHSMGGHYHGDERQEYERRPLWDWCRLFAKKGNWKSIRGLCLWTRRDEADRLRIAMHVTLFGQIKLANDYGQRRFGSLCETYEVGMPLVGRAGGSRAVELAPGFIAELLAEPTVDEMTDTTAQAPSREEMSTNVNGEQKP